MGNCLDGTFSRLRTDRNVPQSMYLFGPSNVFIHTFVPMELSLTQARDMAANLVQVVGTFGTLMLRYVNTIILHNSYCCLFNGFL